MLYVLRYRLDDLNAIWRHIGLIAESDRQTWGSHSQEPWWYVFSDDLDLMARFYMLSRRFQPTQLIAEPRES